MFARQLFCDRADAGRQLAARLTGYKNAAPIVLGLPRGGVPVAFEVARALDAPLDAWIVRKVGAPMQPELGIGAVAEGGEVFLDDETIGLVGVTPEELSALVERTAAEAEARTRALRRGRPPPEVRGRTVIVVDDGVATGGTVRAALRALKKRGPKELVLAVPVGASETLEALRAEADEIVCVESTPALVAVGYWYDDFSATTDEEVEQLLERARADRTGEAIGARSVKVAAHEPALRGDLAVPHGARAIVLFAHGSGSSRKSPRNRFVAEALRRQGLATLLFDLLTLEEERADAIDGHLRFDIDLLARRLLSATDWVRSRPETRALRIGYFGASTGAAAALVAAAERPAEIGAVVSRGGRPDLAGERLARVVAPTLFVVGGYDREVLRLNREALQRLGGPGELAIVPGATHLFEERGALEQVAHVAARFFDLHLGGAHDEARA